MLTVTENASAHLVQLLDDAPDDAVIRFVPTQNGLSVQMSQIEPSDTTFEYQEKTVLALDPQVTEALADRSLDVQATEQGPQLTIQ